MTSKPVIKLFTVHAAPGHELHPRTALSVAIGVDGLTVIESNVSKRAAARMLRLVARRLDNEARRGA